MHFFENVWYFLKFKNIFSNFKLQKHFFFFQNISRTSGMCGTQLSLVPQNFRSNCVIFCTIGKDKKDVLERTMHSTQTKPSVSWGSKPPTLLIGGSTLRPECFWIESPQPTGYWVSLSSSSESGLHVPSSLLNRKSINLKNEKKNISEHSVYFGIIKKNYFSKNYYST